MYSDCSVWLCTIVLTMIGSIGRLMAPKDGRAAEIPHGKKLPIPDPVAFWKARLAGRFVVRRAGVGGWPLVWGGGV